MEIDWDNQPIGFPLWLEGIGEHSCWSGWYKKQGEIYKCMDGGQFREVRNGQFFIVHKKPADECEHSHGNAQGCPECGEDFAPAWSGKGIPPAGAVCEYLGAHQYDVWTVVNIFAEWGEGSRKVVFVDFGDLDGWRAESDPERFRPIRTAEQIAADKRESAVQELVKVTCISHGEARRIYDAGWRKQASD